MSINDMIAMMKMLADDSYSMIDFPSIKALNLLENEFFRLKLPIEHVGKIKFDIDESFFEDEEKAKELISLYAIVLKKTYDTLFSLYGEIGVEKIFPDMLSGMSIVKKILAFS